MLSPKIATKFNRIIKAHTRSFSTSRSFADSATHRDSRTITLPDGRLLGYGEFGHPNGYPLLFFHGFPASRLEAWGADRIARRNRLRVIALDRPGFGLSTFQPGRRIIDWPADVLAFAKQANLERFAVMGGSGGGPYALACALKLPSEMMSAVGVMAGAPPWEVGAHHMSWPRRVTSQAAMRVPAGLGLVTDGLIGLTRRVASSNLVTKRIDAWLESEQKKERLEAKEDGTKQENEGNVGEENPTIPERRERLLRIMFDGFAQGSRGFVQETQLLSDQSWGFEFEDLSYDPILIWHGTKDVSAPFAMIQHMAKRIPHGVLREFEDDTHFTLARHLEQIVLELVPEETRKENSKTS